MNKLKFSAAVALIFISISTFAAKERVIRFQNHVRVGYDDNIYGTSEEKGSAFITDIVNLSLKASFSSRTDALFYWQPQFQYRFDGDPNMVMYQDFYARLNHAISQRAFLTLSDRFRYQEREGQTGIAGGGTRDTNSNYFENDLQGSLQYTLNSVSYLKFGGGYDFRVWDDSRYGSGTAANDFDRIRGNGSYIRQLKPNKTQGILEVNYADLSYDGSRGGFESTTFLVGLDQNFNPNVTGFGRVGFSMNSIDGAVAGSDSDTTSPNLSAGLEVNPTSRTSFSGNVGYSLERSDNSLYNAQDQLRFGLGARHDITAKISLASSVTFIHSNYEADYARATVPDATDDYFIISLRAAYQINRNNFVEAGYQYSNRSSDFSDWDRNRIDVAWRLRL